MIVLDASAAVELLTGALKKSDPLAARVASVAEVHVPELFDLEVLSALRGLERGGRADIGRVAEAIADLEAMRAIRWSHEKLRAAIWSYRHRASIYDAAYLALAETLDLPLITADAKLARAAEGTIAVELLAQRA